MPSSPASEPSLPTIEDIRAAAGRLAGRAVRTPLLRSDALDQVTGARVLVKAEPLQRTGSFKFRGAYNAISRLSPKARARGVVAYSSGNHAQGVAAAAALLEVAATIVMPDDAPAVKLEGTRALGAEIVTYDRARESREALGERLMDERGAALIKPYDAFDTIAGQGTVGLEIAEDLAALGLAPDVLLCPCGGGGLIAGSATALVDAFPEIEIYAVEPEGYDDTARSLAAGERRANATEANALCDALLAPTPGALTFAINRRLLTGGLVVSDDQVLAAMAFAFRHLKLVLEPGGAAALAALLANAIPTAGRTIALVASGGNVDPATFARALNFP